MANPNRTKPILYAVMPALCTAAMVAVGLTYHPGIFVWALGLGGQLLGGVIEWYQIKKGGDTNIFPYVVQFLFALAFCLICTLS